MTADLWPFFNLTRPHSLVHVHLFLFQLIWILSIYTEHVALALCSTCWFQTSPHVAVLYWLVLLEPFLGMCLLCLSSPVKEKIRDCEFHRRGCSFNLAHMNVRANNSLIIECIWAWNFHYRDCDENTILKFASHLWLPVWQLRGRVRENIPIILSKYLSIDCLHFVPLIDVKTFYYRLWKPETCILFVKLQKRTFCWLFFLYILQLSCHYSSALSSTF